VITITLPTLRSSLLDLLKELQGTDIKLIVGGGFGIFLKTEYVQRSGGRTLLQSWPEPRSTNDLDLFLRPELLIESIKLKPLAQAIARLGYKVIPEAAKFQFVKTISSETQIASVKLDLLTGPESRFKGTKVKVDARRARPSPSVGLHAHPVNEAPTLEDGLVPISLSGKLSSGRAWEDEVYLPHPFSFLMMKLFAFKDRLMDANKDMGRYHALDLYSILATTTEPEWNRALALHKEVELDPTVREASGLVSEYFSGNDRLGMLRIKESPYYRSDLQLREFVEALGELFPPSDKAITDP
jgi:hypothetical protein